MKVAAASHFSQKVIPTATQNRDEINSRAISVFSRLHNGLDLDGAATNLDELIPRALAKLDCLQERLKQTESDELRVVQELRVGLMEYAYFHDQINRNSQPRNALIPAAATSVLDSIESLSQILPRISSLQDSLEELPVSTTLSDTGSETTTSASKTKLVKNLGTLSISPAGSSGSNNSAAGASYASHLSNSNTSTSRSYSTRSAGTATRYLFSDLSTNKPRYETAELSETLEYIADNFDHILAGENIDQIFSALGHAFHSCPVNDDDSVKIKAIFNRNNTDKLAYRDSFIKALGASADLRRATRTYISANHKSIYKGYSDLPKWIQTVFYDFKYRDKSIALEAFPANDLREFSTLELEATYSLFTEAELLRRDNEIFMPILINCIEEKLKAQKDDEALLKLRNQILDQMSPKFYSQGNYNQMQAYCRYRGDEFINDLAENFCRTKEYFFKRDNDGLSLADYIIQDEQSHANKKQSPANEEQSPAPKIFEISERKLAFTNDFKKNVLEKFKARIINQFKGGIRRTAGQEITESANYLNECGINTQGLFTNEELFQMLSDLEKQMLFDTNDDLFKKCIQHRNVARGISPFEEGDRALFFAELFRLLSPTGLAPKQIQISEDRLKAIIGKNIEYATEEAHKRNYYAILDLFASYIPNDVKREFLLKSFDGTRLLDDVEKVLGLDLDHFFPPNLIHEISKKDQERILNALNQKEACSDLEERIKGYLERKAYPFKNPLKQGQANRSLFLANLCTDCANLPLRLQIALTNLPSPPGSSIKNILKPIFERELINTELKDEFFDHWDQLEDFDIRLIAARIIKNIQTSPNLSYSLLDDATELSDRRESMRKKFNDFHPQSCMAELLQNRSLPWMLIRNFDDLSKKNIYPGRFGELFLEQSPQWYRANNFAEEISRAKEHNNYLRLLASRASTGFNGNSPALLKGSGEFNTIGTYSPGDDIRYIDWAATYRRENGTIYLKNYIDDIDLKRKEYLIDLESLVSVNHGGNGSVTLPDHGKIEDLLIQLYGNFMNKVEQNLQIRYKSNLILEFSKERLATIFRQGPNSWIDDSYGRRSSLCDLYLTLEFLASEIAKYNDPLIVKPLFKTTDWKPPSSKSQILVSPACDESLVPSCMETFKRCSTKGDEIAIIRLSDPHKKYSPRNGIWSTKTV